MSLTSYLAAPPREKKLLQRCAIVKCIFFLRKTFHSLLDVALEFFCSIIIAMFEELSNRLSEVFKELRGHGKLTEANVADACRDIRRALLEADVNYQAAREIVEKIKNNAIGTGVLESINPGQMMVKVFHDELVELLGPPAPLATCSPLKIMLCGLQGSGKTTTCAKLAKLLLKKDRDPILIAADLQRPAAITQLISLGNQIGVPIHARTDTKNPLEVLRSGLAQAVSLNKNAILIDTAGRLDIDEELLEELRQLHAAAQPQETLFVADAALGQRATDIVTRFQKTVPLTGLILTRLDGDSRGGAALSMRHVTGCPIKFIGTGEKIDMIEVFDARRLADRILGMGDIVGLVERAQEAINLEDAAKLEEKLRRQTFDLDDMLHQIRHIKKMGPLAQILGMIPGAPKLPDPEAAEKQFKRTEAILLSMTPEERRRPELLNARRRQRIARGSGNTVTQVNTLLQQFTTMRKMMKSKGKLKNLLAQMGMKV